MWGRGEGIVRFSHSCTLQLAMLAMLAAFGAEVATGKTIFAQIQTAPLLIGATFVTIIIASVSSTFRHPCTASLPGNGYTASSLVACKRGLGF